MRTSADDATKLQNINTSSSWPGHKVDFDTALLILSSSPRARPSPPWALFRRRTSPLEMLRTSDLRHKGRRISFINRPGTRYARPLSREERSELRSVEQTSSRFVALAYGNEEEELPAKSREPGQKPNISRGIDPLACRQTVNSQYFLSAETRLRQMARA
jgi:hypothetical protein